MTTVYISEKKFDKVNFTETPLVKGEYENCDFTNCDFSHADLSAIKFFACTFTDCNLSLANVTKTSFCDARFKNNKMLGFRFDQCNPFNLSFSFDHCQLNLSSFYKLNIKKTSFKNSQLQEVDFTDCDITQSVFENCDLNRAIFSNTILEKADLISAINYLIDPRLNRIKKAKFSLSGAVGLLKSFEIEIV